MKGSGVWLVGIWFEGKRTLIVCDSHDEAVRIMNEKNSDVLDEIAVWEM